MGGGGWWEDWGDESTTQFLTSESLKKYLNKAVEEEDDIKAKIKCIWYKAKSSKNH